jgi:fermentation-respiration switch protein FrsA (DUF1100 family)
VAFRKVTVVDGFAKPGPARRCGASSDPSPRARYEAPSAIVDPAEPALDQLLRLDQHRQDGHLDAFALVPLIGQRPLLMIVGTEAVTAWMCIEAFQKAVGPKEVHWIDGASHVDLYDKEQYVVPAVDKLAGFFTANLGKTA